MEQALILRSDDVAGLEILTASYERHAFAPHRHPAYVLALIESGVHAFDHRGSVVVAPAGTVVFLDPDERHTGYGHQRSNWTYRVLYADAALFRSVASRRPHFTPEAVHDPELANAIRSLCRSMTEPDAALRRQAMTLDVLHRALRHSDGHAPAPSTNEPDAVRRVREVIDDRYDENLTLSELASIARLSPFRLCHSFRRAVGFAPHEYLMCRRVERARTLLRTGVPPADVAVRVGFCDQSHLTRHFRRRVGVTPGQYRSNTRSAVSA
jgi:AraC-like DNA-binding protein